MPPYSPRQGREHTSPRAQPGVERYACSERKKGSAGETLTVVDDEPRVLHATQPGRIVPRRGGAGTGRPRKPIHLTPQERGQALAYWREREAFSTSMAGSLTRGGASSARSSRSAFGPPTRGYQAPARTAKDGPASTASISPTPGARRCSRTATTDSRSKPQTSGATSAGWASPSRSQTNSETGCRARSQPNTKASSAPASRR
jgi:hypothetical protein